MLLAVQQDEDQPRREQLRNKTGHSDRRRHTMNDAFMKRAYKDELFRRYCGLMGRGPTLPSGQQSKAGSVAPWNWRGFGDRPPPR
eukprot:3170363-Alexandrium_andersonii.AAC.1